MTNLINKLSYSDLKYSWDGLMDNKFDSNYRIIHESLIVASMNYNKGLSCQNTISIVLSCLYLLIQYAYTTESDYGKFTLGYSMRKIKDDGSIDLNSSYGEINFIIGNAIVFRENSKDVPINVILEEVIRIVQIKAEEYDKFRLSSVFIRIYLSNSRDYSPKSLSNDEILNKIKDGFNSEVLVAAKVAKKIRNSNRIYKKPYLTPLKPSKRDRVGFIVADLETLIINKENDYHVHVPYAAGFLVVKPNDEIVLSKRGIETYFSEDYIGVTDDFEERSRRILTDLMTRIAFIAKTNPAIRVVYFHNFSRFDGIILLRHLVLNEKKYTIKPLMRNHVLYEISIYNGNRLLYSLRDSILLLPNSLDQLGKYICPELGSKGSIDHNIKVENLLDQRIELLEYMKQDIYILGGVMQKTQSIYWSSYNVDVVTNLTISAMAMAIFRTKYYDDQKIPIYIPSRNEDTFIRRGYYGGHADAYIPRGENLYYYDVNSLYPYIMKSYPMPCGKPVWHGNLVSYDLDNLFGFIEAYVECPITMKRPFLPYKCKKTHVLKFPTGKFVGVYYSEELKYARRIGYKIYPISGYLFENKNSSPFDNYVLDLFERRKEAKISSNDAMSYIYKLLMNSLYGRFGINPHSTITEICNTDKYNLLLKKSSFISGDKISNDSFIVTYHNNSEDTTDSEWKPPKISAVQLSAAVTACARIHMHPYISRCDCYYTDTDSVVLGSPLPEAEISSTELGKFKLEEIAKKGIFLAPKTYYLLTSNEKSIIKHKGAAKGHVNEEWFTDQYDHIDKLTPVDVAFNFKIDWKKLNITKTNISVNLGIRLNIKREAIYDSNETLVDTKPIEVIDFAGYESTILEYEMKRKDDEIAGLRSQLEKVSEVEKCYEERGEERGEERDDDRVEDRVDERVDERDGDKAKSSLSAANADLKPPSSYNSKKVKDKPG